MKRRLIRKLKSNLDPSTQCALKRTNAEVNKRKRTVRSNFVRKQFQGGTSESRRCWNAIKNVLGQCKRSHGLRRIISNATNCLLTQGDDIANELIRCFTEEPRPQVYHNPPSSTIRHGPEWNPI